MPAKKSLKDKNIKDLHVRIPRKLWERIESSASTERRRPLMQAEILLERGLQASEGQR